jgi:SMC interacting uncharacterized protein involved in chromosome segregation
MGVAEMSKWNPQSQEVQQELRNIRDYGNLDVYNSRNPCGDSYKSQALRELASNMHLRDKLREAHSEAGSRVDQIESLETEIDILKSRLEADTHFLQSDGFLTQHEIEKMKSTLDSYHERYRRHQEVVLRAAEFESPAYWAAQNVISAIAKTIEEMSPKGNK